MVACCVTVHMKRVEELPVPGVDEHCMSFVTLTFVTADAPSPKPAPLIVMTVESAPMSDVAGVIDGTAVEAIG